MILSDNLKMLRNVEISLAMVLLIKQMLSSYLVNNDELKLLLEKKD